MCVLIFAETWNENLKKSSLETISFGKNLADSLGLKTKVVIFSNSEENFQTIGDHGADEIHKFSISLEGIENDKLANLISEIAEKEEVKHVIISNTSRGINSLVHTSTFDIDQESIRIGLNLMSYFAFEL